MRYDREVPLILVTFGSMKEWSIRMEGIIKNFLIRKPGYYQVGVNLTPAGRGDIGAYIMVNGKHGNGYAKGSNGSSLSMVSIVKLELYDSIYVRIFEGTTSTAMDANTFQIAKIN